MIKLNLFLRMSFKGVTHAVFLIAYKRSVKLQCGQYFSFEGGREGLGLTKKGKDSRAKIRSSA